MEKLVKLNAVAVPLPIDNLDTDQIMPKQFLRGVDKPGLAKGTFFNLRCYPDGTRRPDCVFNQPGYEKAGIIVSSPNFGCGSSREHAVWGLMQIGIRAVIAPSFGEIFYSNCFNNGLLAAKVSREDGEAILEAVAESLSVSRLMWRTARFQTAAASGRLNCQTGTVRCCLKDWIWWAQR